MEYFVSKKDFLTVVSLKGKFNAECGEILTKCVQECAGAKGVVIALDNEASLELSGFRAVAGFLRSLREKSALRFVGAPNEVRRTLLDQGFAPAGEFASSLPQALTSLREIVAATTQQT